MQQRLTAVIQGFSIWETYIGKKSNSFLSIGSLDVLTALTMQSTLCLLGHNAEKSSINSLTFRRNILSPSSALKSRPSK
jgi:hypothetical protein